MKALFIGPRFYGYENDICRKLHERGYDVDFFPERNDYLSSILHFSKKIFKKTGHANALYEKQLQRKIARNMYDLFLLIRGEELTYGFVENIIQHNLKKNAKTIYYTWDSISNLPNATQISKLFQRKYTFDLYDAERIGDIIFLPLFYIDTYKNINIKEDMQWDISIVASYSIDRYNIVNKLIEKGFSVKHNLYIKKYLYIKQMICNQSFRKLRKALLSTTVLSSDEIMDIYNKSKAVLDIPSKSQTGLSMRTIECLGCGMKLITTNAEISKYDFYNSNNIFLLNETNLESLSEWLNKEYKPVDEKIRNCYSIDYWIDTIIYGKDGEHST